MCYNYYKYYIFKQQFCNTVNPVKSNLTSYYYNYYKNFSIEIFYND